MKDLSHNFIGKTPRWPVASLNQGNEERMQSTKKKKLAVTPWFSGSVKPVHIGIYERRLQGTTASFEWDGNQWRTPIGPSAFQDAKWRGLAAKPKNEEVTMSSAKPNADGENKVTAPNTEDYMSDPSQGGGGPLVPIVTPPVNPVGGYPKPGEH